MPDPENDDIRFDLTFSGRDRDYLRPTAIGVAVAGIVFIIATMTTTVAAKLLPMSEEYMQVLVPVAADGAEPLALKSLEHEVDDMTMTVHGTVDNRTDYTVSSIVVSVTMQDTTGRFPQTLEVPVLPVDLPAKATGTFTATRALGLMVFSSWINCARSSME